MEPPRTHKFIVKEEVESKDLLKKKVESKDGNDLLVKHTIFQKQLVKCIAESTVQLRQPTIFKKQLVKLRRTAGSTVELQQPIEVLGVFGMENKAPDNLLLEDSTGKNPMDLLTSCAVQNSVKIKFFDMENKASDGLPVEDSAGKDPMDVLTSCAVQNSGNELAISNLLLLCKAIHCKEPSFDFEEEGPQHMKMFKCKVTIHLDGLGNTIVECFSNPKPNKKAAQENAAQGATWFLKRTILQG